MARSRQRLRRGKGHPATAFAGGEDQKGRSIQWEQILDVPVPVTLGTVFGTAVRSVGAFDTALITVIPVNVTRGTITLERVRGCFDVYFDSAELAASLDNWPVFVSLQMVQARDGAIRPSSALSPMNAADQESNKIIWQRHYYPDTGTTITSPGPLERHTSNYFALEVDIKSKRRFDRATWALALVVEAEAAAMDIHLCHGSLRALFRTSDGV